MGSLLLSVESASVEYESEGGVVLRAGVGSWLWSAVKERSPFGCLSDRRVEVGVRRVVGLVLVLLSHREGMAVGW